MEASHSTTRPIRIVAATGLYPPEIGGPATHVTFLERSLPNRLSITVLPFRTVRQYAKGLRHGIYTLRLWRLAAQADLIYALDPVSVGLPARIVAKLRGIPLVLRLGGDYAWEQAHQRYAAKTLPHEFVEEPLKSQPFVIRLLIRIERYVARHAVAIVTPSAYLQSVVAAWGIQPERIHVIYNPHEAQPVPALPAPEIPTILMAGRLIALKRFAAVIALMPSLRERVPGAVLKIAGSGEDEAQLREQVQTLGLQDCVQFLGPLQQPELFRAMQHASVFVLNSTHESFPNIVLEAMSNGVPVIATAVGGTKEIIVHEENGLLVPSGDTEALLRALERLLTDEALHTRLRLSGRESIDRFAVPLILSKWEQLLTACARPQAK